MYRRIQTKPAIFVSLVQCFLQKILTFRHIYAESADFPSVHTSLDWPESQANTSNSLEKNVAMLLQVNK